MDHSVVMKSIYTLSLLNDLNNVITVELFKATDDPIHGQGRVAGTDNPVGQQRKTGIHVTAEFLQQTPLISYKYMRVK